MPSDRFFLEGSLEGKLELTGQEHHHLHRVMRLKENDCVELVNGRGSLAQAKILHLKNRSTLLELHSLKKEAPNPYPLFLAVPFMRPSKLELIVEKASELGAEGFYLYQAQYSEKKKLSSHLLLRLKQIAISSMKQCARLFLPPITPVSFPSLFTQKAEKFYGDLEGGPNQRFSAQSPTLFISGPEKGFSPEEKKLLEKNAQGILLNKHILRAETAPLAATAIFNGNFF